MLIPIFFIGLISQTLAENYTFYVSNSGKCISNCDGSINSPYPDLYSTFEKFAFQYPSASHADIFTISIDPTPNPYYIFQNTVVYASPFNSFQGALVIENMVPDPDFNKVPIIIWASNSLIIQVNYFLRITGLIINGINAHVAQNSICSSQTINTCCTVKSILDPKSVCLLQNKTFQTLNGADDGLIILGSSATLEISGLTLIYFHGLINYRSFISPSTSQTSIIINSLIMSQSYFIRGVISFYTEDSTIFNFSFQNISISDWNKYNVSIALENVKLFDIVSPANFLFGFRNSNNSLIINNIQLINIRSDYIFLFGDTFLTLSNVTSQGFSGIMIFRIFGNTLFNMENSKFTSIIALNSIQSAFLSSTHDLPENSYLSFSDLMISDSIAMLIDLENTEMNITNALFTNISFPIFVEESGLIIYCTTASKVNINGLTLANLNNLINSVFYFTVYSTEISTFQNCNFLNISFLDSFTFLFQYFQLSLLSSLIMNVQCSQGLFEVPMLNNGPNLLNINNTFFINISSQHYGPFLMITQSDSLVLLTNSTFNLVFSGLFFCLGKPFPNVTIILDHSFFLNFYVLSGILFAHLEGESLFCYSSVFQNITFLESFLFNAVFIIDQASGVFFDSIFNNFQFLNGDGDFILCKNGAVTISNVKVNEFYMQGKGGLRSIASTLKIYNSIFNNIYKFEDGFIKVSDALILNIDNSSFLNINGFKYSVLSVRNANNLTISNSFFYNSTSDFEAAVFSITSSQPGNSIFWILNNTFLLNQAMISYAGTILLTNSEVPMVLINNKFNQGYSSLSGALIYATDILNLSLFNNNFEDSASNQNGGALNIINTGLMIENCSFLNNAAGINGKGGQIYLENSNLTINSSRFSNKIIGFGGLQGSCLYASYSNENPYMIIINNTIIEDFVGDLEVIFISSALNFKTILRNFSLNNSISNIQEAIISITSNDIEVEGVVLTNNKGYSADLFEIIANENVKISQLTIENNRLGLNGNLLIISNANNIEIIDLIINENYLEDAYMNFLDFNELSVNNLEVSDNQATNINVDSQFLFLIDTGNLVFIENLQAINSNLSLFSITNVKNSTVSDIIARDLYSINSDFIWITQGLYSNFINISIINSIIPSIYIQNGNISLFDLAFINITIQNNSNYFLNVAKSSSFLINGLFLKSINQGIVLDTVNNVSIQGFFFENPMNPMQNSIITLIFCSQIQQFSISDSSIFNIPTSKAFEFLNSLANTPNIVFLTNITINTCLTPLDITGFYYISIKSSQFLNISSTQINFISQNPNSTLVLSQNLINQHTGTSDPTITDFSIIIPNDQFYLDFILKNQDLIEKNLSFWSYTYEISMFWGENIETPIDNNSLIEIYSGEAFYLKLSAFNHFNNPTSSSDKWQVELSQITASYELRNYQTIFLGDQAFLSDSSVIIPENQQGLNTTLDMIVLINKSSDDTQISLKNFSMYLNFRIKKCDKGKTLISDQCVMCDSESYSLVESPTDADNCITCPSNAICINGSMIAPQIGYWNLNYDSLNIIKCEIEEACDFQIINDIGVICTEKYTGNVCAECQVFYGKTIIKQCLYCDKGYLGPQIVRTLFKILILALISLYNFKLLLKIKQGLNKQIQRICGIFNNFIFHFTTFAIIVNLQTTVDTNFVNFLEIQSVFSYFENNLFLIYCIFPTLLGFQLALVMFAYLFVEIILQFLIASLILSLLRKNIGRDYLILGYVVYFHNFSTILYYFLGLVFPFWVSDSASYSIYFKEISYAGADFFYILGFVLLFWLFLILLSLKYNRTLSETPYLLLFEDHENKKYLYFIKSFILFGLVSMTNYSFEDEIPLFCQKMIYLYIALMITFRILKDNLLFIFKIVSLVILIISFSDYSIIIMVLNTIYFIVCVIGTVGFFYLEKIKINRRKNKELTN